MKITFLGTAHGVPEPDRYCSSALIEENGKKYLIDAGAPVVDLLIRMGITPDKIDAIFITHWHGDHFNGLSDFVSICAWYFTAAATKIYVPLEKSVNTLGMWYESTDHSHIEKTVYGDGAVFDDGNIKVTSYPTLHSEGSHAFKVEAGDKRVVFTGDLGHPTKDMPICCFEEHCDIVVCESAHFDISKCTDVFDKMLMDRLIINHINPRHSIEDYNNLEAKEHDYKLDLSYDGMAVEF